MNTDNRIEQIDGKTFNFNEHSLSLLDKPVIFTNMIDKWSISAWTVDDFATKYWYIKTKFKLYLKETLENFRGVVMETDCYYVDAEFYQFRDWLRGLNCDGELSKFPK